MADCLRFPMKLTKTMLKYVKTGIEIERKGLRFYKNAMKQAIDPNSKRLLKFLIGEEESHLEMFQAMAKQTNKKLPKEKHGKIPLFKKTDYKKVKKSPTTIKIFLTALEMEERGIQFYMQAAKKVKDPEISEFLIDLAKWEQEHFKLIKEHQDALYNEWYWHAMEQPRFNT